MRKLWVAMILTAGCGSDPLVEAASEWVGVYALEQYQVDQGCGDTLEETEPPHSHVQLDVRFGESLHEVNLRPCASVDDCVNAPWFSFFVEDFPADALYGIHGDYSYAGASGVGSCSLWWTVATFEWAQADELRIDIRGQTRDDLLVADEEECIALLEALDDETDCDTRFILQGARVR